MSFFSDINGFNEKFVKNVSNKYDKKDEFKDVDFCQNDMEGNFFGVKISGYDLDGDTFELSNKSDDNEFNFKNFEDYEW